MLCVFLVTLVKQLQKATSSFVIPDPPFTCPHGTAWLLPDGFPL